MTEATKTRTGATEQPPAPSLGERTRQSLSVFRVPGFPFLLGSNSVAFAGFQVRNMAQGWLVLELTDSAFLVGVVNAVPALALLIFSTFGGVLADRYNKRIVAIQSRLSVALLTFLTAYLVAADLIEIWQLIVLGFFVGLAFSLGNASSQTLAFDLVGRERILGAQSLNTMVSNLASVVGPALGGVLVASVGISGAFWLLAGIYGAGFLFLLGIPRSVGTANTISTGKSAWADTLDGIKYAFGTPGVNWMMVLMTTVMFWGAMQPVIPVYARDVLDVGADGFGLLFGMWAAGALVAAVVLFVAGDVGQKATKVLLAVVLYAAATIGFAYSRNYPLSLMLMFLTGIAGATWISLMFTMIQTSVEDAMRGRVMGVAVASLQFLGFGFLIGGALTDLVSASAALVAPSLLWVAVTALAFWRSRELRQIA